MKNFKSFSSKKALLLAISFSAIGPWNSAALAANFGSATAAVFATDSGLESASGGSSVLSAIVRIDVTDNTADTSVKICPDSKADHSCLATWAQAVAYCNSRGGHLPTAREYADRLRPLGTLTLEPSEVANTPPAGYYLVASINLDGSTDAFYINHQGFRRPELLSSKEQVNHLLWTASSPPGHLQYAHVYYDQWGGGGGDPQDHLKNKLNSFQCVTKQK